MSYAKWQPFCLGLDVLKGDGHILRLTNASHNEFMRWHWAVKCGAYQVSQSLVKTVPGGNSMPSMTHGHSDLSIHSSPGNNKLDNFQNMLSESIWSIELLCLLLCSIQVGIPTNQMRVRDVSDDINDISITLCVSCVQQTIKLLIASPLCQF